MIGGVSYYNDYIYGPTAKATMISPTPSTTLTGASTTFTWTTGTAVTQYLLSVGTVVGLSDLASFSGTATSYTANLPVIGATIYVRLTSIIGGVAQFVDYTYTEANLLAQMTSPALGSTLAGPSTTFTWTAGTGVTQYQIWFGTTVGGFDLGSPGILATTSYTANNLPIRGGTLYVRLWSSLGGVWQYIDYTYTNPSLLAAMVSPAPGSTLAGASVAFTWTAGTGVTQYQIWFGTTQGGFDLGSPGILTATTYTPTNLPVGHATLYVRLWSLLGGVWQSNDYVYTEANLGMITPVPGATLLGSSVAFTWTAVAGVTQYQIWFGTTTGGFDLGSPGILTTTSYTANNLPVTGGTLHVRLWSLVGAVWQFTDYAYTEATFAATMISPAPGTALTGTSIPFTWSAGTGATAYQIWFGSTLGGFDLGSPGILTTTLYTATLPVTGAPLYVRLWSSVSGVWQYIDYIYTH